MGGRACSGMVRCKAERGIHPGAYWVVREEGFRSDNAADGHSWTGDQEDAGDRGPGKPVRYALEFRRRLGGLLVRYPHDHPATGLKQQSRRADRLHWVGDGPREDSGKSPRVHVWIARIDRPVNHSHPGQAEDAADMEEKRCALSARLDQRDAQAGAGDCERHTGKPGPGPQISDLGRVRQIPQHHVAGQGIEDVVGDDLAWIARAGQVHPAIPHVEFGQIPGELVDLGGRKRHAKFGGTAREQGDRGLQPFPRAPL